MNTKLKGVLQLLVILLVTAAVCVVAYTGIGGAKRGSAKNIRLGLDLAGGVSVTYEATKENPTAQEMKDTVYKMQMRVQNESTEASVYQEGISVLRLTFRMLMIHRQYWTSLEKRERWNLFFTTM